MVTTIQYLTKIQFGEGALGVLPEELRLLNITRPLVITDRGVVAAGLIGRVIAATGLAEMPPVFDATPENPTEVAVEEALAQFRSAGCDGILAVGGGSSLDLAKGVALLATHAGPLRQYAAIEGGVAKISAEVLPVIAVPTTAGTGSEVGRAALITLKDKRKLGFLSPYLIPRVAVCDPELTRSLPRGLTAGTGMDALTHCVETFLSPKDNPVADAIALDGLSRSYRFLPRVFANGEDMEARSEMMMAALQGALAFQKGLGAVHSMSHALGGLEGVKLHHGTLNAVLLPAVLRFNEPACEAKYVRLRQAMGLPDGADVAAAIEALNRDLGMPANLREMGVREETLDQAALWSLEDHSTATNGRPADLGNFRDLLREAFG